MIPWQETDLQLPFKAVVNPTGGLGELRAPVFEKKAAKYHLGFQGRKPDKVPPWVPFQFTLNYSCLCAGAPFFS